MGNDTKSSKFGYYKPLMVHFGIVLLVTLILFCTIASMGDFLYALLISLYLLLLYIPSTVIIALLCFFKFSHLPWIFIILDFISVIVVIAVLSIHYDQIKEAFDKHKESS